MKKDKIFYLPDGKSMGYLECGDLIGMPLLFLPGFPSSRLHALDFHDVAIANKFRLLSIDRPGHGLSTFVKNYSLLDWAKDLNVFLVSQKIEEIRIIAHSGGAPYALSVAYENPDVVIQIDLISPLAPTMSKQAKSGMLKSLTVINALVRNVPYFSHFLMLVYKNVMLRPKNFHKLFDDMPECDQKIFKDEVNRTKALSALQEAFKQGVKGPAYEFYLILNQWPFALAEIKTPVHIWHGDKDLQVPQSMIDVLTSQLANVHLHTCQNEAHLSTLYNNFETILNTHRFC